MRIRCQKEEPYASRPQATPDGVLILYGDESCTFSLEKPDGADVEAAWASKGLAKGEQKDGQYRVDVMADPDGAYPRQHTVIALAACGEYSIPVEVRLPYAVPQPEDLVAGDSLYLKALPLPGVEAVQDEILWELRRGDSGRFGPVALPFAVKRGHYQAVGMRGGRIVASAGLDVKWDRAAVSRVVLKHQAWLATILVAIVATIAGLAYIAWKVPTFGSPMDYILALGWAFGLSGAAAPKQGVVEAILHALGKTNSVEVEVIEVPNIVDKTLADARTEVEGKFDLDYEGQDPSETSVIATQKPAAQEKKEKHSAIQVTFKPAEKPDDGPDDDGKPKPGDGVEPKEGEDAEPKPGEDAEPAKP